MCTALLFYKVIEDYPVVLGENRDSHMKAEEMAPNKVSEDPKIFSALDKGSEGTWFGLNEYGVVVGLTNLYSKRENVKADKSRGKLCLGALEQSSAKEVSEYLEEEFDYRKYKKSNIISADKNNAFLSRCDREIKITPLGAGTYVFTNYDFSHEPETEKDTDLMIDSKHRGDRAIEILERASLNGLDEALDVLKAIFRDHKKADYERGSEFKRYFTICCHGDGQYPWETKSSSIVALSEKGLEKSKYLYAPGNPCQVEYKDYSYMFSTFKSE